MYGYFLANEFRLRPLLFEFFEYRVDGSAWHEYFLANGFFGYQVY